MTSPPSLRPTRHRAAPPLSRTVQRLLPPLASVTAVVAVVVILLVLNSRPSRPDAGPVVVRPHTSPTVTPSVTPSAVRTTASVPVSASAPASAPAPPVTEPPATQSAATGRPAAARPPVTVLNNSRRHGLAAHVAADLRARGWAIAKTGNFTGRVALTTAYYAAGQRAAAEQLAHEFPQVQRVAPRFAGLPGAGLTVVVTRTWTG